jgi:tRNA(Ile)-lysidine synthase
LKEIPRGATICVAASGGADSTTLALLTKAVLGRGQWNMCLATVNHNLRHEAQGEAEFAQRLAAWMDVPCSMLQVHPAAGAGVADRARTHRYKALSNSAMQAGAAVILTAHHAQDQLETMLLRLARGAGPKAIGGMRARRKLKSGVILLRPLLEVSREELRALLTHAEIPWQEDPTNADQSKPRARIRAHILPVLESIHKGASVRASRAGRRLRESGRLMQKTAQKVMTGVGPWPRDQLRAHGPALLATALKRFDVEANERELEAAVAAMRDRVSKPRVFQVGKNSFSVNAHNVRLNAFK